MNYTELQDELSINSPFILKRQIEQEDHFHFTNDQLLLNEKAIGRYTIEEHENYYRINCINEISHFKTPMLIVLNYKQKLVVLTSKDKNSKSGIRLESLETLPKLIPHDQFLADEKAEL